MIKWTKIHGYLHHHKLCRRGNLTLTEMQNSENDILVCVHDSSFMNETTSLKNRDPASKDHHMASVKSVVVDGSLSLKNINLKMIYLNFLKNVFIF